MAIGNPDILLTFDDGPHPVWTPSILDLLSKYHQKAIFFILGRNITGNEDIIRRAISEGHHIGNHGMNHRPLLLDSPKRFEREILATHQSVEAKFGYTIHYFRPPWGIIHSKLKKRIEAELGYETLLWDIDSLDYIWPFRRKIAINGRKGRVILFHDGHAWSPLRNKAHSLKLIKDLLVRSSD